MNADQARQLFTVGEIKNKAAKQNALADLLESLHPNDPAVLMAADMLRGNHSARIRLNAEHEPKPHARLSETHSGRFLRYKGLRRQGLGYEAAILVIADSEGLTFEAVQDSVKAGQDFLKRFPDLDPDIPPPT